MRKVLLPWLAVTIVAFAGDEATARSPEEIYKQICAQCHEGGVPRAPHSVEFQMIGPDQIYAALTEGVMKPQGSLLSDQEKRSLSEFLGGRALLFGRCVEHGEERQV